MHKSAFNPWHWYLLLVLVLALALRLLVWHWHTFYPLGGDEQEYFNQALTLLREHRYEELRLMRPPLYTLFLAGCIVVVDSFVHRLRLIQAILSTLTVIPVWLLTAEILRRYQAVSSHSSYSSHSSQVWRMAPPIAATLCALSYTLADHATELLTETLFLLGLTTLLWLLVRATARRHEGGDGGEDMTGQGSNGGNEQQESPRLYSATLAGVVLGLLCLLRSVALPLLILGTLWLLLAPRPTATTSTPRAKRRARAAPVLFVAAAMLVILPWTVRNYATYGSVILIDTTGAENLWLDNAPEGREAVKAQLYAMGDDRAARQQLAMQRGIQAMVEHPQHVVTKAGGELLEFFALEYTDDMLERRAIWVPPAEVWARLILGDGLFLLVLLGGTAGLWMRVRVHVPQTRAGMFPTISDPRWLLVPWVLYTLLTAMLFHVELRYRLPLYPVLLPYAAMTLIQATHTIRATVRAKVQKRKERKASRQEKEMAWSNSVREAAARPAQRELRQEGCISPRRLLALVLHPALLVAVLIVLHAPYPALAWQLGRKHIHLGQAEQLLQQRDIGAARAAARAALATDPDSVLARVALARAAMLAGHNEQATPHLHEAIALLSAHPSPHLLLGDLLRQRGDLVAAREELSYETASLQDVQAWSWQWFTTTPTTTLPIGNGLDLGMIQGFYATAPGEHWRWTKEQARVQLAAVPPSSTLRLRLASGRPAAAPDPTLHIATSTGDTQTFQVVSGWNTYSLHLNGPDTGPGPGAGPGMSPAAVSMPRLIVELHSETFRPRSYDPTSGDGRSLGVMVDWVEVETLLPVTSDE
jgi:hypothetical protein